MRERSLHQSSIIRGSVFQSPGELLLTGMGWQRDILDPITPPLLPSSPPMDPFVPSSPAGCVELLSDQTNLTDAELRAVDEEIAKRDSISGPDPNLIDGIDPMLLGPSVADELISSPPP